MKKTWRAQLISKTSRAGWPCAVWWALAVMALVGLGSSAAAQALGSLPRPSQAQVAWQFFSAVLRADYSEAYVRLAPEVRTAISRSRFEEAARPIRARGQRLSPQIALYKLGIRLGERGKSRLFYTFSFAADSLRKPPPVLLEVTFRDTVARGVLGFRMHANPLAKRVSAPTRPLYQPASALKPAVARPKTASSKTGK